MGPSDTANDTTPAPWNHNHEPETSIMPPGTPQQGDIEASTAKEETHPDDRDLYNRICEILDSSSLPLDTSSTLAVVLYSDTFCPILKYHSQLISELATAIPALLQKSIDREHLTHPTQADMALSPDTLASTLEDISPNVLAMILSPKSDVFIRGALAVPFQLDLFDRMRLARIQIAESFSHLEMPLLLDDSFGQLQDRNKSPFDKSQPNQSMQSEAKRLQTILERVATTDVALELITVLEQSQTDLYGIPVDLPGKVVYVVTRRTLNKSRGNVATVRWVDRVFLKAGYTSEWIAANLLTVYARIDTEGANEHEEAGEDWDSEDRDSGDEDEDKIQESFGSQESEKYLEEVIYLSNLRPEEAKVRVMVKQNRGENVFEPGVLAQVQRSKLFEMQAIRKPRFSQMMGALSLGNSTGHQSHPHHEHFNINNHNHDHNHNHSNSSHNSRGHASNTSNSSNASNPFL